MRLIYSILLVMSSVFCLNSYAEAQSAPRVGRAAAAKYFQPANRDPAESGGGGYNGPDDHYLAIHVGRYMGSQTYEWGKNGSESNVGSNTFGVTYRVGEWYKSMDMAIRIDYSEYDLAGEKPTKLSLMPLYMFPDASSRFPLYFGAGAGLGVFFKQVDGKSAISLDYQLVAGARFFNVFENTGFFIETGIKNHLHLLSSGQMNGTFLALGAVFTF